MLSLRIIRDTKIGPPGPAGPQGPAGANGTQGIQGIQGPIGPIGPQGPAGANGTKGETGPQGPSGLSPINDTELQCEECIKYWSHAFNAGGEFRNFINDLSEFINSINFNFTADLSTNHPDCEAVAGPFPNPSASVICLSIASPNAEQNISQVYDVCEQFELAILFKAQQDGTSITVAFEDFAADFLDAIPVPPNGQEFRVATALMECFRERVIPNLEESQPLQTVSTQQLFQQTEDSPIITQQTEDSPIVTQGTGDSSALAKIEKLKAQYVELYQ